MKLTPKGTIVALEPCEVLKVFSKSSTSHTNGYTIPKSTTGNTRKANVNARIKKHNSGKGSKYCAGRSPVSLVYQEPAEGRSSASKREAEIKKMSRHGKYKLITMECHYG